MNTWIKIKNVYFILEEIVSIGVAQDGDDWTVTFYGKHKDTVTPALTETEKNTVLSYLQSAINNNVNTKMFDFLA